jgi:hypothetical protein
MAAFSTMTDPVTIATPTWSGNPADLIDLDRYPLLDPGGAVLGGVVAAAREQMGGLGLAELGGFVRGDALGLLVADAESLAPMAWRSGGLGTAYLAAPDADLPEAHPLRWAGPYSVGAVGYDLFPPGSPLRALYEWDPLMRFIEAILGRGELYRYADPCGALNLAVMGDGDELQWHFDMTDFVASLALRDAEAGGDFDVAPLIRSESSESYDAVGEVLGGSLDRVVTLEMTPGTLLVFEGRHSLHRVSPISGPVDRYVGLLAYDTKPGTVSSDALRRVRYDRG